MIIRIINFSIVILIIIILIMLYLISNQKAYFMYKKYKEDVTVIYDDNSSVYFPKTNYYER